MRTKLLSVTPTAFQVKLCDEGVEFLYALGTVTQSCTHHTGAEMLQVLAKACQGETTSTKLLFQRIKGALTVPKSVERLLVQALQLSIPAKLPESVLPLFALYPVLIQPRLVVGGPEPESAAVSPRAVSYRSVEVSWISQIEPMWYPVVQAASAWLPSKVPVVR